MRFSIPLFSFFKKSYVDKVLLSVIFFQPNTLFGELGMLTVIRICPVEMYLPLRPAGCVGPQTAVEALPPRAMVFEEGPLRGDSFP